MKKIIIAYWHSPINGVKFRHLQEFPYSTRKQNSIIKYLLKKKLSVMLRPLNDELMIYIDSGRFGQK